MHIQSTANGHVTWWLSRTCHVFAMSVLALLFPSSNSRMDQFVTDQRKFPLTLSLTKKKISGIGLVSGFANPCVLNPHVLKTEPVFTSINLNSFLVPDITVVLVPALSLNLNHVLGNDFSSNTKYAELNIISLAWHNLMLFTTHCKRAA